QGTLVPTEKIVAAEPFKRGFHAPLTAAFQHPRIGAAPGAIQLQRAALARRLQRRAGPSAGAAPVDRALWPGLRPPPDDGPCLGIVEQHFGVADEDGIAAVGALIFDGRPYPFGHLVARAVFRKVIDGFRGRADTDIAGMDNGLFQPEVAVLELLIVWDG